MKRYVLLISMLFICAFASSFAQVRIAVLPFINMDGNMAYNIWCYKLQDSVYKELKALDPEGKYYVILPPDSVEAVLGQLNVNPTSPEYPSDMWKAVELLKVDKVISGNFKIKAERFLINAYIYFPVTKLPDPNFQVRDIFKKPDNVMEAVPIMIRTFKKAFLPN